MRGHGNDASAKGFSDGKDAFGHGARAHFAGRGDTVIGELRANGVEILLSSRCFLGVLVSWSDPMEPLGVRDDCNEMDRLMELCREERREWDDALGVFGGVQGNQNSFKHGSSPSTWLGATQYSSTTLLAEGMRRARTRVDCAPTAQHDERSPAGAPSP